MRGAILPGQARVDLKEFEVPESVPGRALVRMKASGLCGSDLRAIYHEHAGADPNERYQNVIAGHEPAGQDEAVGPGVSGFEISWEKREPDARPGQAQGVSPIQPPPEQRPPHLPNSSSSLTPNAPLRYPDACASSAAHVGGFSAPLPRQNPPSLDETRRNPGDEGYARMHRRGKVRSGEAEVLGTGRWSGRREPRVP